MIRRLGRWLLPIVGLLMAPGAEAHTFYIALTRIDYNARSGMIEIIHRLTAHDVAAVLSFEQGERLDFENFERMEGLVDGYVAAHFSLAADGLALTPEFLGMDLVGEELNAYYEAPLAVAPRQLAIENSLFLAELPEQRNRVVVRVGDAVADAGFHAGATSAILSFAP